MIQTITLPDLPGCLREIPSPPKQLYISTEDAEAFAGLMQRPRVAIVGSRRVSAYGQAVTSRLAGELAAQGVVIVSGLAIGVDAIAHRAALEAGGLTLAVLPGPVEQVYPRSHMTLARHLLESGGALVSEYPADTFSYKQNFVARNRIVAGLSNVLLITEAAINSGTLHTARFALEQGIDVLAIPGNITSPTSAGTNNLLKSGATPVTGIDDILYALNLMPTGKKSSLRSRVKGANAEEQHIINLLEQGVSDGNQLLTASGLSVDQFNHHLTMLEITTKIRPLGANIWALR